VAVTMTEQKVAQDALLGTYKADRPTIVSGNGCRVTTDDGRQLLDMVAGIGVNALGYNSAIVNGAIASALSTGVVHTSNLYRNEPSLKLAELLTNASFAEKVFFCNSGGEANEAALKFARRYARAVGDGEKYEIVALKGSFHGRLFGTLAATDRPSYRAPFEPLMPGVRFVMPGDYEGAKAAVSRARTAAIIAEPVQGEGGVKPLDPTFLKFLRELASDNDAVLIFDEVQCGMGRTGSLFAYEQFGVTPDIVTLAKPLAGGLPMGATLVNEKIAECIKPGDHATTFGGGPVVSAVACAVIQTIAQPSFLAEVQRKAEKLGAALHALSRSHAHALSARGAGLMWGVEFDCAVAPYVQAAFEKGLLITSAGENVIRLLPPLVISDAEIDEGMAILQQVLS
jgi:acetylornithine/N-succinyldiaminopimelate aminotransferase